MGTSKKIAVVGATGRAGRHIVDFLESAGHAVVPISRSTGVDVITGTGLAEALQGVESIVDAATGPSPEEEAATQCFTTAARNLHAVGAGRRRADRRRLDHRGRSVRGWVRSGEGRARAGGPRGADPGADPVPREESLIEAAKLLAASRGNSLRIEPATEVADSDREVYESGGLLPGPKAILAGPTYAEWLRS